MHPLRGPYSIVLLSALLSVLISCDGGTGPGASSGASGGSSRGPTLVVAQTAMIREILEEIEALGTAEANESVTITARVTDTISKVNFQDSQIVEKDQVLVELTRQAGNGTAG